ncbi:HdeD family acid-resistance protein [Elizabethkingia meningoseptica]|uniref:HdeD family acid-resistance protein n=1 Tax=Elizabethkingia meningoseptica TaxID=238 RepID=UPI0038921390
MSNSFNTTIKSGIKNWYIPVISGLYTILAGLIILINRSISGPAFNILIGTVFIVSGLLSIIFTIRNRKLINGWGLYMLYGILIFDLGIYLSFYAGDSLFFVLGIGALLRSGIYLGTSLELKKHEHPKWNYLAITGGLGILLSFILITNSFSTISPYTITSVCFIIIGVSAVLLSLEFKKVNRFYEIIRKLSKL